MPVYAIKINFVVVRGCCRYHYVSVLTCGFVSRLPFYP